MFTGFLYYTVHRYNLILTYCLFFKSILFFYNFLSRVLKFFLSLYFANIFRSLELLSAISQDIFQKIRKVLHSHELCTIYIQYKSIYPFIMKYAYIFKPVFSLHYMYFDHKFTLYTECCSKCILVRLKTEIFVKTYKFIISSYTQPGFSMTFLSNEL